ncbi:beta-glucosidase family protein [Nocardioides cheoyonin]|uniref:beta-glucosidase family protein n=1 Tax=Nocardioides cheoyonin TaxID=3156615 RepID=UPI0032B3CB2F
MAAAALAASLAGLPFTASGAAPAAHASAITKAAKPAQPTLAESALRDRRVQSLLRQLTLDEKMTLLSGAQEPAATAEYQAGYLPGIPRLGIPSLRLTDGPPGVATRRVSTGMTSTMGVAATFDTATARANGKVIGDDARALGQDVVLEPFINIDRDPTTGRGWNTFGEDPLLTGTIAASEIEGIQSTGTLAQAKHYIAYDGANGNVVVDAQTLHEIYAKPFEYAVDAGVASVMCSYNAVNGAAACGNSDTLEGVLKGDLGFQGFVTSDWGANHGTDFLADGLDLEMPGGGLGGFIPQYFSKDNLTAALASGTITEADIDDAVGRILYEYDRFGLLSGHSKHTVTPENIDGNAKVVQATAEKAAVLLKNSGKGLPLSRKALSSLALIGPGAGQTIATGGGGESSTGRADRWVGTATTLKKAAPSARITYAVADDLTGTPVPASALSHDGAPGLLRTNPDGSTQVDPQVNFTDAIHSALPAGTAYTWTGTLTAPEAGTYWINLGELGTTGSVSIDGATVIGSGGFLGGGPRYGTVKAGDDGVLASTDGLDNMRAQVTLTAGQHTLSISNTPDVSGDPVQLHLFWVTPSQQAANRAAAIAAAQKADTAVVFAYATPSGGQLTALPEGQDQLISDIAAVNPNTIVVLQSNNPVNMPWLSSVKAVLEAWFPGDEGGWAFADLLTGKASPGGHLPFTWPVSPAQGVASDPTHPERTSLGVDPGTTTPCTAAGGFGSIPNCETDYSEGIYVGYRWYDQQNLTPLFPFGYGLSYARFAYSNLHATRTRAGGLAVSLTVRNTGSSRADAVPQIYLGAPTTTPAGVEFAKRALAGYTRVTLAPRRSTTVRLEIPRETLSYWSASAHGWKTATGTRTVYVGNSSRDLPLHQTISIH